VIRNPHTKQPVH